MGNETNILYTFAVGGGSATGAFLLGGIDQQEKCREYDENRRKYQLKKKR
ncbi:hypothetical protein GN156_14490 [bacterium LRH843]|nr:hypothetical protein [bacterium LRH843]